MARVLPTSAVTSTSCILGTIGLSIALVGLAIAQPNPVTGVIIATLAYSVPGLWAELAASRPTLDLSRAFARRTLSRVAAKSIGLFAIFALLGFAYWFFPGYAGLRIVATKLVGLAPVFAVVCILYLWVTDLRLRRPDDAYAKLGRSLLSGRLENSDDMRQLLLGWAVKGFFLPLMAGFAVVNMNQMMGAGLAGLSAPGKAAFFMSLINLMFLVDVVAGLSGYMLTFKLFGTDIRSTDATPGGWFSALMCYPPFWPVIAANFLGRSDNKDWDYWLSFSPALTFLWGLAIVALVAIYVWATLSFGVRFSNLTHRGIITHGPYRYTKHPAYIAKNLAWWMMSMPFLSKAGAGPAILACLALIGTNLIYVWRARTEERHLMADKTYEAYANWIRKHGLFARLAWQRASHAAG